MAATVVKDIQTKPTPVQEAQVGITARRPSSAGIAVYVYHPDGHAVFSQNTCHALLLSTASTSANSLFHTGCAVVTERDSNNNEHEVVYTTSDLLATVDSAQLPVVLITRIAVQRSTENNITGASWSKLRPPPSMPMPGAMLPYSIAPKKGVLFCAQGNMAARTGGLFFMPHMRPPQPLIDAFGGVDLNSPRDVAVHPRDGALWFTDPHTGFDKDIRNESQLPNHVYRADAQTKEVRAVDDSLQRPTSLCFSPDGSTLYVSDVWREPRPGRRSVYAFDVVDRSGGTFLTNRRLFAHTQGSPQCVRCDGSGNVYIASGSRIEVRSAGGTLVAAVDVPGAGSVSSFCFTTAACDELYVCAGQELWWVRR